MSKKKTKKVSTMVAYEKVVKTINSCTEWKHYFPTLKLIRNFRINYLNYTSSDRWLLRKLEIMHSNHFDKIDLSK